MKHLKTYKIFESSNDSIIQDLQDIYLEVNDDPLWNVRCWLDHKLVFTSWDGQKSYNNSFVIIIEIVDEDYEHEMEGQNPPPIVPECIKRSIDFMKGKGFNNYKITFEEEESDGVELIDNLHIDSVSKLDVWSNNFIRIEFW